MALKLTPPPRVNPNGGSKVYYSGGVGFKTVAALLSLSAIAVGVFVFLPRLVDEADVVEVAPQPEMVAEANTDPSPKPLAAPSAVAVAEQPPPRRPTPTGKLVEPISPVESHHGESAFTEAMSEGLNALSRQDFSAAKLSFERADTLRPGAPDVRDALARADEGLRLRAIAEHRERAIAFERSEQWRQAEAEYDALLSLEPTLQLALVGKERSARRAELAERLDFHIGHAKRLSDDNVLKEASRLAGEASAVGSPGPKHLERLRRLEEAIQSFSTPVLVELHSDQRTEVTIYRVGRLGKFERHTLELRPGTYTVLGSCEGYRDVRRELVIDAGVSPQPLIVRCEERI